MKAAKPLELPPKVARAFISAMNDYFVEVNPTKRDAIRRASA